MATNSELLTASVLAASLIPPPLPIPLLPAKLPKKSVWLTFTTLATFVLAPPLATSRPPPLPSVPPARPRARLLLTSEVERLSVVAVSSIPPPLTPTLPVIVVSKMAITLFGTSWTGALALPARMPPPLPWLTFPWIVLSAISVSGPPSWMPPPPRSAALSRNVVPFSTVRLPRFPSSPNPPPVAPEKLYSTTSPLNVTLPVPALPTPPPWPMKAMLLLMTAPLIVVLAVTPSTASSQSPPP